ncbi:MAG: hypothetical protein IMZ71_02640 [Chloroflexi bacterium]|nr:hypothetical protein [Chloroflexota bacterium]
MRRFVVKTRPTGAAPEETKHERAPKKKRMEDVLAERGERFVTFAINTDLWECFKAKECQGRKPNEAFVEMVERAVAT